MLACGSGAVRLLDQDNVVNNRNYNEIGEAVIEGVVEVCYSGEWSSVCDISVIPGNFAGLVCFALKYFGKCGFNDSNVCMYVRM